ncbi:glycine--tRNA ligase [Candidatus Pacearchaeota archaeon]|nr:glycine--tRNA ligase [Candidatus Pacearchaeota archaeon]
MVSSALTIDELAQFCKRKGFIFRSSDIYGGFSGFWDYGPLGVELFQKVKQDFWRWFVARDDMAGIEASVISHPMTWQASGHIASFSDVAVVCTKCKQATKLDKSEVGKVTCACGGAYDVQGEFSLMFKTHVGALKPTEAYLRGETAQAMFMDFKLVQETARKQLPFGIAQVGRCFRNEIAPRDFIFRCREFTIGEFEFFIHPDEKMCALLDKAHTKVKVRLLDAETQVKGKETLSETTIGEMVKEGRLDEWHAYWLAEQLLWFDSLGLADKIKIREHMKTELSHYSSATFDLDFEYPFGSKEVGGNANRGQYDLGQHAQFSKQKLELFDEKTKQKVVPRVIEPTFGIDRIVMALLCNAYDHDTARDNVILHLPARLAPAQVAVFPLTGKGKEESIARDLVKALRTEGWGVVYDESGSIGKRYARQDESGTPLCITIDPETEKTSKVTVRDRDSTKQVTIKVDEVVDVVRKVIRGESLVKLGKAVETRVK